MSNTENRLGYDLEFVARTRAAVALVSPLAARYVGPCTDGANLIAPPDVVAAVDLLALAASTGGVFDAQCVFWSRG